MRGTATPCFQPDSSARAEFQTKFGDTGHVSRLETETTILQALSLMNSGKYVLAAIDPEQSRDSGGSDQQGSVFGH